MKTIFKYLFVSLLCLSLIHCKNNSKPAEAESTKTLTKPNRAESGVHLNPEQVIANLEKVIELSDEQKTRITEMVNESKSILEGVQTTTDLEEQRRQRQKIKQDFYDKILAGVLDAGQAEKVEKARKEGKLK